MAPTACVPSACLLTSLPDCLPPCLLLLACLPACLPACLHACLLACLIACLLDCLLACLPACLLACLLDCLHLDPFLSSLELLFHVLLRKVTDTRTHGRTHKIPSSRAPVGAKYKIYLVFHLF